MVPSSRASPIAATTPSSARTGKNSQSAGSIRPVPRPAGSPSVSADSAAAVSLSVSVAWPGACAIGCGSGRPLSNAALQSNTRAISCTATAPISASVRPDSSRRASPAMVALRAALASARRAWSRTRAASWLVTAATMNKTIIVITSDGRSMRKLWIGWVKK